MPHTKILVLGYSVIADTPGLVELAQAGSRDAPFELKKVGLGGVHLHQLKFLLGTILDQNPCDLLILEIGTPGYRWANGAHRAKRAKVVSITPLDDIPGVGATRKRALLAHFGSAKAVSRAGLSDLMAVAGISEAMAQAIHDYFHDR